jgi:hypothetical protein
VELLEARRLLNGSDDLAGHDFDEDTELPDEESASEKSESDVELDDLDHETESDHEFDEAEDQEFESHDEFVEFENRESEDEQRFEAEDDDAYEVDDNRSWQPLTSGESAAGGSLEHDDDPLASTSTGDNDAEPPRASTTASMAQAPVETSNNSDDLNGTSGSAKSDAPAASTTQNDASQSRRAADDMADEAIGGSEAVTTATSESAADSESRLPVTHRIETQSGHVADEHVDESGAVARWQRDQKAPGASVEPRDSASLIAVSAKSADAHTAERSGTAVDGKASEHTGRQQKDSIDSAAKVESGAGAVASNAKAALASTFAALGPVQVPLATVFDAVLATQPQVAGLLTNFLAIDVESIEREIDSILDQLAGLRRELAGSLAELNLPTWLLAAAVGAATAELVRLQKRRVPVALAAVVRNGDSSTWLPDSAGPTPEELT